jgi:HK97 family phage major capsid protein
MKRTQLKFPSRPISYLPKMATRRFPGLARHGNAAYKSDGEDGNDERTQLLKDIQKKVGDEIEKRGFVPKSEVESLISKQFEGMDLEALRKYKKDSEENAETIRNMAEKLEKMEKRAQGTTDRTPSLAQQIRSQIESRKQEWDDFRARKVTSFPLELRAAGTMLISTNTGSSAYLPEPEIVPGLVDLPRNKPFMMTISNVTNTNKARIVWAEKRNPDGNAAFIGEGVVKPLIDFDIVTVDSVAKKAADAIKVSTEMLDDIDFMAGEIEKELQYKVEIVASEGLLSGDGTGDNLKGLDAFAGGFVATGIETTDPNNADAIRAAIAQIRSLNFNANMAVINPIDAANMELEKGTDGHYLIPPFKSADGTTISGVKVIEDNGIPVGYVLVGDMTRFRVRVYKPFTASYGWENDDFRKNLVTIIGEMRLHSYVPGNEVGAFVYDTFANIKSAITGA